MNRAQLSIQFMRGQGLEIAPLHFPFPISNGAQVKYLDRYTNSSLKEQYPELGDVEFPKLDFIGDGQYLDDFKKESFDFIIASHFLEHCEDAIESLSCWLEKIKPGGYLFLALPDKSNVFDKNRELTTWEHFLEDFSALTIKEFNIVHYLEWHEVVDKFCGSRLTKVVKKDIRLNTHIHFHTWTFESWCEFLNKITKVICEKFTMIHNSQEGEEFLTVLRRESNES